MICILFLGEICVYILIWGSFLRNFLLDIWFSFLFVIVKWFCFRIFRLVVIVIVVFLWLLVIMIVIILVFLVLIIVFLILGFVGLIILIKFRIVKLFFKLLCVNCKILGFCLYIL